MDKEMVQQWSRVEKAAPHSRRILLYGPPGTGKSYLARTAGVKDGQEVYPIAIHSDLPAAELRGHFIPTQDGGMKWMDGPATAAWRSGGRLVLDEIDRAGDDALSFLLGVLDDTPTARLVLGTTGEIITPHPSFSVIATMNGEPEDLPDALADRFPVSVRITEPHPNAIAALSPDLRGLGESLTVHEDANRRIPLRSLLEYDTLRTHIGKDDAAALIFGARAREVIDALELAAVAEPK